MVICAHDIYSAHKYLSLRTSTMLERNMKTFVFFMTVQYVRQLQKATRIPHVHPSWICTLVYVSREHYLARVGGHIKGTASSQPSSRGLKLKVQAAEEGQRYERMTKQTGVTLHLDVYLNVPCEYFW